MVHGICLDRTKKVNSNLKVLMPNTGRPFLVLKLKTVYEQMKQLAIQLTAAIHIHKFKNIVYKM